MTVALPGADRAPLQRELSLNFGKSSSIKRQGSLVVNKFLFAAYALVWILFMVYAWSLSRRQSRLMREIEGLKARTGSTDRGTRAGDGKRETRDERIG